MELSADCEAKQEELKERAATLPCHTYALDLPKRCRKNNKYKVK